MLIHRSGKGQEAGATSLSVRLKVLKLSCKFLRRDLRLRQKDRLCTHPTISADIISLYGRVARQKSLWSKKHMTACREFAKWSLQSSESMREKFFFFFFFWYDETKIELFGLAPTLRSWHSDRRLSKRTGTTHRVGNTASTKERDRKP